MQMLLDRGISTRRGIMLAHREPAYAEDGKQRAKSAEPQTALDSQSSTLNPRLSTLDDFKCKTVDLTPGVLRQSEFASANSLLLPLFPQMTHEQQDAVLTALFSITAETVCADVDGIMEVN